MDSSNGAYSRTQNLPSGRAFEARESTESQGPRLQKKRSYPGVRNASQPLPRAYEQGGDGEQARKGSLRDVMRRIFGRRSKEVSPQPVQRSPPRHQYHRSEPAASSLVPQVEEAKPDPDDEYIPHRTLSAPLQQLPSPSFQRVRSPYAVEFPKTARLKPLPLGDPFYAPGSQLRRRKTLPTLVTTDDKADTIVSSPDDPAVPSFEEPRDSPTPGLLSRISTSKSAKRRSRSADDLRHATAEASPPRKRSDEIRYWRDSFQGNALQPSVLRASGFTSKALRDNSLDLQADDRTPMPKTEDPFTTRQSRSTTMKSSPISPRVQDGAIFSDADIRSASGYGTELSRDLEERVRNLEAGLHNFQQSLARLTTDRNRRTVLVGGMPQRKLSTDARTPSMLADTLANPLALASLQYDLQETERPSTSPQPPRTPIRATNFNHPPMPPLPLIERMAEPFSTPPPQLETGTTAAPNRARGNTTGGSSYTSKANAVPQQLYDWLTEERTARRRLEAQLENMRHEITALHNQVSAGSGMQSQRSSFNALDPMVGSSSRLRDLLRETETADSSPRQQAPIRDSGATAFSTSTGTQPVISRFSNSESEAGAPAESAENLMTLYENYRTPREERNRFYCGDDEHQRHSDDEGEMF
ncbi:hypothetical protein LTR27_004604 [Elasticomyces elasticus]|nr:hypothetical protein LTR27_004604 [Elasticomyces elasticus]